MGKGLQAVLDAIDIETFLVGASETECERLARALMQDMGFADGDVLFLEHRTMGARVRLRAYVHRPGRRYAWVEGRAEDVTRPRQGAPDDSAGGDDRDAG